MYLKQLILPIMVMALFNACGKDSTESGGSLSNGLVAHYKFDGNAEDSSGNGNHGTEYNGVSYVDGVIGKAGHLDNSYITISDSEKITFKNEFSITAFIKPTATDGKWITLLTKGNTSSLDTAYEIVYECASMCLPYIRFTDAENKKVFLTFNGKNALNLNKYNFISWVFKQGQLQIFLDGVLLYDKNIGITNLKQDTTQLLEIGRDVPGAIEFFKGDIDDLRFYNRALSKSEIKELYELK